MKGRMNVTLQDIQLEVAGVGLWVKVPGEQGRGK